MDRSDNKHRFGSCDICVAGGHGQPATSRFVIPCPQCCPPFDIHDVLARMTSLENGELRRMTTAVLTQLVGRIEKLEALQPVQLEQLASAVATDLPPNGEEIDS